MRANRALAVVIRAGLRRIKDKVVGPRAHRETVVSV